MSRDNFTDGVSKTCAVLGDITNRVAKRGLLLVYDDLGRKSGDGYGKKVGGKDGDSRFAKQACLGVENLVKEKCKTKIGADNSNEKGFFPLKDIQASDSSTTNCKIDNSQENKVSVISHKPNRTKEMSNLLDGSVHFVKSTTMSAGEVGDASRDSCASSGSMPTSSGRLASCKNGSFELDRCTALKDCSCSFCMKAAYIWSDLYYQDIKGRIAALKKSQKEASILANKYARAKQTNTHSQGNSNKSSKLESDLTDQWKSLFCHMEDIFAEENSQLQETFVTLNDLRENCKMDLEKTTGMPSDKY